MRRIIVVATVLALFGMALPAVARSSGVVTTNADSGPGSLRDALEKGKRPIVIRRGVGDIEIDDALVWSHAKTLDIRGTGQTITDSDGSADGALLIVSQGADTRISRLGFDGPGGFGLTNKGGGSGIRVDVPSGERGTVAVSLSRVSISDVGLHGLHVDDLTNATRASVRLNLYRVKVSGVGFGGFDQDGIRVDERGPGHIFFRSVSSDFDSVGADGVELDEGGSGGVYSNVRNSNFTDNGNYCSFRFDGEELETEVDEADLDDFLAGYTDNEVECLEIEIDNGVAEVGIDVDDAFDIDEADGGSISSRFSGGTLVGNQDEGIDLDEEGPGDIIGSVSGTSAHDNTDEAVKYSEEDAGKVIATVNRLSMDGEDIEFEEAGDGSLRSSLTRSTIKDLSLAEEDEGNLTSYTGRSTLDDVESEETGDGDLKALFNRSTLDDIELTQEDAGTGGVTFIETTYDDLDLDGVTVG
jgi:hypothetical protein